MASPDLGLGSTCEDEDMEEKCSLCKEKFEVPKVLSCLHVFCEECLKKQVQKNPFTSSSIECPDCAQETKLGMKGVSGLPLDYMTSNKLDMDAMENMQIICTSCKAKEKAVARCTECATFLCNNCVTAHQYMRCFENHKVVSFEDMKGTGDGFKTFHKPVTCMSHPEELVKFYCHTCHIPICNDCMVAEHKQPEHHYEKASDAESKQKEELKNLVAESQSKVKLCEDTSTNLQTYLSELQLQRDNAKSHIEETFQSYKVMLEKHKDQLLVELDTIHSNQELQVMETSHNVEKTIEKIDDACKFAERLLNQANAMEILTLKHVVGSQLLSLINNTPKLETSAHVRFDTDEKKFEDAVKETFGTISKPDSLLKRNDTPPSQKLSPLHSTSSYESEGYSLPTGVISPDTTLTSLDVDLTNSLVVQYNLAQLAGMAEGNASQNASNSATSPMSFSDLLHTSEADMSARLNTINNLTALAKMGSVQMNDSQVILNGHLVSGLSIDTATMPNSPIHSSNAANHLLRAMATPSPIENYENLLNGSSPSSSLSNSLTSTRVGSPLDSSLMNGTAIIGSGFRNSSMLPPSGMSPIGDSGYNPAPRSATVKLNTMQIRCKFGQLGPGKCQFSSPHGFCLGVEEEIIVADTNNHRIQIFDKTGEFRYQFGVSGKDEGQLWYPRKVAVMRSSGKYVVCDRGNERSRMQIFTKTGHFLKKIAIRYIDIVAGLAITNEGNIVAVDSVAPTVFIISEAGDLLHWFDCSEHMREPSDIAVNGKEFYVCDFKGHCVVVFSETGHFMRKIGSENVTNFPNGIDVSDAGDVLVGDSHGNRFHIVVFSRQGTILSEFECPYVKVSRCCGLKITSEGYVVTLAKNNHHVLVLNTLYIV